MFACSQSIGRTNGKFQPGRDIRTLIGYFFIINNKGRVGMNREAIGATGHFVSGLAVIITLGY
jgi:hypothetical protein